MARYSSIAADSSARACSRWPVCGVEGAEAQVAVGLERAHAQFVGQGEGLAVVGFGLLDIRSIAMGVHLAKESCGPRLTAVFLRLVGMRVCLHRQCLRLRIPAGQPIDFAQLGGIHRIATNRTCQLGRLDALLQQGQGFADLSGQGQRMTEVQGEAVTLWRRFQTRQSSRLRAWKGIACWKSPLHTYR